MSRCVLTQFLRLSLNLSTVPPFFFLWQILYQSLKLCVTSELADSPITAEGFMCVSVHFNDKTKANKRKSCKNAHFIITVVYT